MGAIEGRELRVAVCPLCDSFETKRLTNFEAHVIDKHGKTLKDVWDAVNDGPGRCACGCGAETRWNGWWKGYSKVLTGHNGSIYATCTPEEAAQISKKRSASLKGKESWCKGLTAEGDPRVAARGAATSSGRKAAFESGDIVAWNKGSTAASDPRIAAAAEQLKIQYAEGKVTPWAKGLTRETDERVDAMANRVSMTLRQENIRRYLDSMKRLGTEEIRERVEASGRLRVVGGLESYINDAQKVIQVQCSSCSEVFYGSLRSLQYGKCFKCSPGGSVAQESIAVWLESIGCTVKRNDRTKLGGLELDIYVPDSCLGIEYNGLYWHSHTNRSSSYHANKTAAAVAAGVNLLHVFEDEWRDKTDIVKSMISSRLKMSTQSVGARRCVVKPLQPGIRRSFFETNHIDGDVASKAAWGLFDRDTLVYALSVRSPFHRKEGVIEVARCAAALGHNVPGGLSRLVREASAWGRQEGYDKLMTYVDTRHGGTGRGYAVAGFVEVDRTPPRFWWTDFEERYNRFKYRADSANGLTEAEVAEAAGVVKIWGCENVVYEMTLR